MFAALGTLLPERRLFLESNTQLLLPRDGRGTKDWLVLVLTEWGQVCRDAHPLG